MATVDGDAFRDCMTELVDDCRTMLDDEFCLRVYEVKTVTRTWDGAERGLGGFTDVTVIIAPRPRVKEPAPYMERSSVGSYEKGDRIVDKLSATLTKTDLTGGKLGALVEFFWVINDEAYAVVGEPAERYVDWKVHLKRMNRIRVV